MGYQPFAVYKADGTYFWTVWGKGAAKKLADRLGGYFLPA